MLLARVEGKAVSTVKHPSMTGWTLLVVQPLNWRSRPEGCPLLALDPLNAAGGDLVLISNDGRGARELVGDRTSPVRWTVLGIVDDGETTLNDDDR